MVWGAALKFPMHEITIKTGKRIEAKEITNHVAHTASGCQNGHVSLLCLHTTCGLTINENADPDVMRDILAAFDRMVPASYPYLHSEGNSDAHIKASLVGHSLLIPVSEGKLVLGTWQGIYLMEFDGPRERKVLLSFVK
jgi:secondary thiamine-phosphate synthase enzyme